MSSDNRETIAVTTTSNSNETIHGLNPRSEIIDTKELHRGRLLVDRALQLIHYESFDSYIKTLRDSKVKDVVFSPYFLCGAIIAWPTARLIKSPSLGSLIVIGTGFVAGGLYFGPFQIPKYPLPGRTEMYPTPKGDTSKGPQ